MNPCTIHGTRLLTNLLPDDPCHLVPVEFHHGILDHNLTRSCAPKNPEGERVLRIGDAFVSAPVAYVLRRGAHLLLTSDTVGRSVVQYRPARGTRANMVVDGGREAIASNQLPTSPILIAVRVRLTPEIPG